MFSDVRRSRYGHDLDVGIQTLERALRRVDLRRAERVERVDDLALQVRLVDDVRVDDAEPADARRREVERRRRAEAARADQQHAAVEQLQLSFLTDLRNQDVARVARAPLGRERARQLDLVAVPLPVGEPAVQRADVLVAELEQRLRRERRAVAGGAVDDDRRGLVGHDALDPRLEMAARDVHGAGDVAFLPLVALTHVDPRRAR